MRTYRVQASRDDGVAYKPVVIDIHVSNDGKVVQVEEVS